MTDPTSAARAPIDLAGLKQRASAAVKATEYKYFGDYEMSDGQREAVDTLVECAMVLPALLSEIESLRAALAEAEAAKKALAGLVATIDPILADLGPPGQDGWTQGYAHTTDLDRLNQVLGDARALITPNSDGDEA